MTMATYLVTGGAGFMGRTSFMNWCEGATVVRVLDNLSTGRIVNVEDVSDRIPLYEMDICDLGRFPGFSRARIMSFISRRFLRWRAPLPTRCLQTRSTSPGL